MHNLRGRAKNGLENIVELGVLRCCSECKKTKLIEDFSLNKRSPDGRRSWCKECFNSYAKSYNKNYYSSNLDKESLRGKKFKADNRLRYKEYAYKRRGLLETNPGYEHISEQDWREIVLHHDNKCHYCNKQCENLTIDHVVPIIKGGAHNKTNIVPACGRCNSRKGAKSYAGFMLELVADKLPN